MMGELLLGIQLVLSGFEIVLCYQFVFLCWADKGVLTASRRLLLGSTTAVLGVILTMGREESVFSGKTFLLELLILCLSVLGIPEKGKAVGYEIVSTYVTLTALLDFFFTFLVLQYITDDAVKGEIYYHFSGCKVLIFLCSRLVMLFIYMAIKRSRIEIKKTICGYGKILAVVWIGMLAVLKVYQMILDSAVRYSISIIKVTSAAVSLLMIVILFFFTLSLLLKNANILGVVDALVLKDEMIGENYRQISMVMDESREAIHDMKHHLQILEEYAIEENIEKIQEYLKEIASPVLALEKIVWSETKILNLILNQKRIEAEELGIHTEFQIDKGCALQMGEHEICSLFCNLLDNALEACEKVREGERWIQVEIEEKQGLTFLRIANSADHPQKEKKGEFKSTKGGPHGLGLKSVRRIVERYHGDIQFMTSDSEFQVFITIF